MLKAATLLLPRERLALPREGQRRRVAWRRSEHERMIARPKAPA